MIDLKSIDVKEDEYLIFKHSSTCPVSTNALNEVRDAQKHMKIPVYKIIVQTQKDLSNEVAKKFDVKHESPQILLIKKGKAIWSATHHDITMFKILDSLR